MIDDAMLARIAGLYLKPGRDKRDISAVRAMLEAAERTAPSLSDPEAVKAAIWFHRIAEGEARGADRQRSAAIAREWLSGYAADERVDFVVRTVLATGDQQLPAFADRRKAEDAATVLDLAMAQLDADWDVQGSHPGSACPVDCPKTDTCMVRERIAVLERIAARPAIYLAAGTHRRDEGKARNEVAHLLHGYRSQPACARMAACGR